MVLKVKAKSVKGAFFYRTLTDNEIKAYERQVKIKAMRDAGATFREIAVKFGISIPRARQLYFKSLNYVEVAEKGNENA